MKMKRFSLFDLGTSTPLGTFGVAPFDSALGGFRF